MGRKDKPIDAGADSHGSFTINWLLGIRAAIVVGLALGLIVAFLMGKQPWDDPMPLVVLIVFAIVAVLETVRYYRTGQWKQ